MVNWNIFGKPPAKKAAAPKVTAAQSMYTQQAGPSMQSYERYTPENSAAIKYAQDKGYGQATARGGYDSGVTDVRNMQRAMAGYQSPTVAAPINLGGGASSGGSKKGGGGRRKGGGGGGSNAAALAQAQLDFLLPILGQKNYTATPETAVRDAISQRQQGVASATAQDTATANTSWDAVDNWLKTNQSNPYANVQLQRANVSPSYNPYLESQGVAPLNPVNQNPDDSYGGFQNVLSLLGANQIASNESQMAGSGMGRASSITGINAQDNAFQDAIRQQLAQVAQTEYTNQQSLDAERRAAILQLAPLLGAGAKAPADFMARLGMQ